MIVAKFRIDHAACLIDHHLLVQRGAERLCDSALDLSAALHWIGDATGIRGMHAFQDFDFSGAFVHRDAEALDIVGHGAGRTRRCAVCCQGSSLRARGFGKLSERQMLLAANHGITFQDA